MVEDTKNLRPLAELPAFRRVVRHPEYVGTAGALALNAGLLRELAQKEPNPELCQPERTAAPAARVSAGPGLQNR